MKSNRILTRKIMGLDYRVWRVMIIFIILAAGLLSYKLIDTPKCAPVDFRIKAISDQDSVYYTDEILSFRILGSEKNVRWDFDDKTGNAEGPFVTHRFANDGKYFIKVTVNSGCEFVKPITIKKTILAETDSTVKRIIGHDKTYVRTSETFSFSKTANAYEWKVSEHPKLGTRNTPTATFKFEEAGDYIIELTLNNDRLKRYTKVIKVAAIPKLIDDDKTESKSDDGGADPSKIVISESTFAEYLGKVISGTYYAADFDKYLCSGGATPVIFNGKKDKQVSFTIACKELQKRVNKNFTGIGKRAKKIKSVKLNRDANLCVTFIEITYD